MIFSNKAAIVLLICCLVVGAASIIMACKQSLTRPAVYNTTAKATQVQLGKYLFFDRRLSINNTRACGTCHNPQFAFTDGYKRSLGAFADLHQRNTQPLFNLASQKYFTAADSTLHTALQQMENPLFNTHPIEMGIKGNEAMILQKIAADTAYITLFKKANLPINWQHIKQAIAQFVLSLTSINSPYDAYINGDSTALTQQQKLGKQLFYSAITGCSQCHAGANFASPSFINTHGDTSFYYNTGLYNIGGNGAYPSYDQGLYQLTKNKLDMGKFRVPTLRNLAFTAPYLHDGSAATLTEVINNYANAGRHIYTGVYKGNGAKNKYKHPAIKGFSLTAAQQLQLVQFLLSLSDSSFVNNPLHQNPFVVDETKQ